MSASGVRFVLHSHLPFAQLAGRRLQRGTWLHTAATEPCVPPMQALNRLRDEGVEPMIVLGLNQTLSESVIDSDLFGSLFGIESIIELPCAVIDDEDDLDDDFDDDFDDDDLEDDLEDEDLDEEDEDYYDDDPDEGDDLDD